MMKGGEDYNGDQESPGKKSKKDHEKEIITHSAMGYLSIAMNLYHEETFVVLFFSPVRRQATHYPQAGRVPGPE
jgi:hypothetical protein